MWQPSVIIRFFSNIYYLRLTSSASYSAAALFFSFAKERKFYNKNKFSDNSEFTKNSQTRLHTYANVSDFYIY